jgi:hypothetical protein
MVSTLNILVPPIAQKKVIFITLLTTSHLQANEEIWKDIFVFILGIIIWWMWIRSIFFRNISLTHDIKYYMMWRNILLCVQGWKIKMDGKWTLN